MKKMPCFLLAILLLPLFGCQHIDNEKTYAFYYPRSDYGHNALQGKFYESILEVETRDDISYQNLLEMLTIYLSGPTTPDLMNPYPENMSLEAVSIVDQTLYMTVSDHLSELTGIQLMIACACLGKTGMELTNTISVQISCEKALLDGKKAITLYEDQIIITDSAPNATAGQE